MKGYNTNKGFSLIELIVVVAIMAVLVVILAPSLLTYNERSRAEKDNSSMDEVVNAIQLAMADSAVYDEVLRFSTVDNISCYVDTNSEANYTRVITKSNPNGVDQYTFTSDARRLDETPYFAAGNMRGVTITFAPDKGSNGSTFDLKQGVVNQYVQVNGNQRVGAMPELYNRIRSSVGDVITNTSQTYRNSEYTVFIAIGTSGGNEESAQDATRFYGQWSGTNLPAQVSYQIVSDRTVGDPGNQLVEIDDSKWNEKNGSKLTLKPGDLNGGGSFTPGTETGNKDYYTIDDFEEDEKDMYVYIINNNTLVFRNSPREDMSDVTTDYGKDPYNRPYSRQWISNNEITKAVIETPVLIRDGYGLFYGLINLEEIENQKNICMDQCTDMFKMFYDCKKIKEIDSTYWDTSNVTNMSQAFCGCRNLETLDVSKWDTGNVNSTAAAFQDCRKLKELDVSDWDTSNVTAMHGMFSNCELLSTIDAGCFDTSHVTTMNSMFYNCAKIESLDLSKWNTSNVVNMKDMFSGCKNITKIDVADWNTNSTTNMNGLFYGCNKMELLDVSKWDTSSVKDMSFMFNGCSKITEINVSNWDTSNVINMHAMFLGCANVQVLDVSNWNVENVGSIGSMFGSCGSVEVLDVSNWNTSKVTNMSYAFNCCGKIAELDVSNWNTSNVTNMDGMFAFDRKLSYLDVSNWDTGKVTNMRNLFSSCQSLMTLELLEWNVEKVTNMQSMFNNCPAPKPSWYVE